MKRSEVKKGKRLSDTVLDNLEPDHVDYRILDGDNLYFRVKTNGTKSWQLRYKTLDNKWAWRGLGSYPSVSGVKARKLAFELLNASYNGTPIQTQKEKRIAEIEKVNSTFEQIAQEWLDTKKQRWTEGTWTRNVGALEKHIYPTFGKSDFKSIMPKDWFEHLLGIQRELGINEQVKRMASLCREIYDLAKVKGKIQYNPLDGVNKFLDPAESKNMKHVSLEELPRLLQVINNYPTPDVRIGLQLLVMLFPRPSELREAKWDEFNLKKAMWIRPAERMKTRIEHAIPLPKQAIELLKELKKYSGDSEFLFPGRTNLDKPRSDTIFIMALRRLGYGEKQSPHGFRHIASSAWNRKYPTMGQVVESALAHLKKGVKGIYDKEAHFEDRIEMQQWWADELDLMMSKTHLNINY
ncbi:MULTISPECIES: tyrosine-type recombinase/integrase [unclassified Acinetobacter]|uniref:tyrosine-type recombinase/integrase n=1 Tax=unclassified Acinetobacter TaxID=196816 RepID=UPI003AF99FE5